MILRLRSESARAALLYRRYQRVAFGCTGLERHALLTVRIVIRPAAIANPKPQAGQIPWVKTQLNAAFQPLSLDGAPPFLRGCGKKLVANSIGNLAGDCEVHELLILQGRMRPRQLRSPLAKSILRRAFDSNLADRARQDNPVTLLDSKERMGRPYVLQCFSAQVFDRISNMKA